MKHLLLATLLLVSISTALADTPAKIAEDYRKAAATALVKVNDMLEKATTPLIAKLVASGDTAGAEMLTTQLKAKLAGEPVAVPQASAVLLFAQYDQARAKALEPAQKASISRIEGMLKPGASSPKLEVVTELGKVRAEIEAGKPAAGADSITEQGKMRAETEGGPVKNASPASYLDKQKIPKVWGYYVSNKYDVRHGTLRLKDDGSMVIEAGNPVTGAWSQTSNPNVLSVFMKNATFVEENTEIILVNGREATMKRLSGMKYLKAD
jgi:hypothetical protein